MLKQERLHLTNIEENNNKFYHMQELDAASIAELPDKLQDKAAGLSHCFVVTWGREGSKGQQAVFPMYEWDTKLNQKVRKGYKRLTDLLVVADGTGPAPEDDPCVQTLINFLQTASSQRVNTNYNIASVGEVTKGQIDEVQVLLNAFGKMIAKNATPYALTQQLNAIMTILPRKTDRNIRELKIDTIDQAKERLQAEQDMVDSLAAQVKVATSSGEKITETMDLTIAPAPHLIDALLHNTPVIYDHDGRKKGKVVSAWTVTDAKSEERYQSYKANDLNHKEALYCHGSRNANWMSIFDTGLYIRPSNVPTNGSLFGNAIYFANDPMKSLGYTGLSGVKRYASDDQDKVYIAWFKVNVGRDLKLRNRGDEKNLIRYLEDVNEQELNKAGYDSLHVVGGYEAPTFGRVYNDEITVYNPARCTIAAIMEVIPA